MYKHNMRSLISHCVNKSYYASTIVNIKRISNKQNLRTNSMNRDLLKEAIADAKAVKETAIANAKAALEEAFIRAWSSIRDSNITTLISCVFMIWMGIGFVKGFAVTLAVGVLVSMFTAITITRVLVRFSFHWFGDKAGCMFLGGKAANKEVKE